MENWKSIPGFSESYEASDYGRIRSINRITNNGHFYQGKVLSQKRQENGYMTVHLSYKNKLVTCLVHRLVASTFLGDSMGRQINHKNEDKSDNRVCNLEWCSPSYNCKYGHRNDEMIRQRRKPVVQLDLDGNVIRKFNVLNEAARETGVSAGHISQVCNGKRNHAGGYRWIFQAIEEVEKAGNSVSD